MEVGRRRLGASQFLSAHVLEEREEREGDKKCDAADVVTDGLGVSHLMEEAINLDGEGQDDDQGYKPSQLEAVLFHQVPGEQDDAEGEEGNIIDLVVELGLFM